MEQKKIFFPNLDGLRFFCFLSVFLFHTWSLVYAGTNITSGIHLFENGNLGVNFFFVLSGYLITYLLIAEKNANGVVNIPKFWMRRILRIWPLYFLCVFLGFVAIPYVLQLAGKPQPPTASAISYITFTSNFDYIKHGYPGSTVLEVLWSIAVEEQFYF
ncbi:MAG: acyltransferase, partial [Bacteroidota bacterium]